MRRFLINLKQEFPKLDFKELSSKKLKILFTIRRLSNAIKQSPRKIKEVSGTSEILWIVQKNVH
ncbi:MAG: hypothetical protein Ct9H300mP21_10360 [Pseudomonadota bacterium]|nr:MAG: hypothetical protein Ct9H300mP21_10360 [Pseudomonadota bacterium]